MINNERKIEIAEAFLMETTNERAQINYAIETGNLKLLKILLEEKEPLFGLFEEESAKIRIYAIEQGNVEMFENALPKLYTYVEDICEEITKIADAKIDSDIKVEMVRLVITRTEVESMKIAALQHAIGLNNTLILETICELTPNAVYNKQPYSVFIDARNASAPNSIIALFKRGLKPDEETVNILSRWVISERNLELTKVMIEHGAFNFNLLDKSVVYNHFKYLEQVIKEMDVPVRGLANILFDLSKIEYLSMEEQEKGEKEYLNEDLAKLIIDKLSSKFN